MEQRFTARSLLHRLARVPLSGVNLIAVRPRTRVATWLVAHYDAKGQPLSMAARLAAAALAAVGVAELLGLALRALLGTAHPGMVDGVLVGTGAEGYGLLGARALVRKRANLLADTIVVNFDGIDDSGTTIALIHRDGATVQRVARALGARRARWLPVVVDGLVLGTMARECVTIM